MSLTLNSIFAVFFACFLAYTFFAQPHLEGLARTFVTEKTLKYSEPIFEMADASLGSPLVPKLLSKEQLASIRREIDAYREDAPRYIANLTRQEQLAAIVENKNPLLAKISSIKERIRFFYDNSLTALIADLRIFSTSNLCASVIAFLLAYYSQRDLQKSIVWFSFLMFAAVLYCSYLYVDDLNFFRILFRWHMGWRYPVVLCVVLVALYLDYGVADRATKHQSD